MHRDEGPADHIEEEPDQIDGMIEDGNDDPVPLLPEPVILELSEMGAIPILPFPEIPVIADPAPGEEPQQEALLALVEALELNGELAPVEELEEDAGVAPVEDPEQDAVQAPAAEPRQDAVQPPAAEPRQDAEQAPAANPLQNAVQAPAAEPRQDAVQPPAAEPRQDAEQASAANPLQNAVQAPAVEPQRDAVHPAAELAPVAEPEGNAEPAADAAPAEEIEDAVVPEDAALELGAELGPVAEFDPVRIFDFAAAIEPAAELEVAAGLRLLPLDEHAEEPEYAAMYALAEPVAGPAMYALPEPVAGPAMYALPEPVAGPAMYALPEPVAGPVHVHEDHRLPELIDEHGEGAHALNVLGDVEAPEDLPGPMGEQPNILEVPMFDLAIRVPPQPGARQNPLGDRVYVPEGGWNDPPEPPGSAELKGVPVRHRLRRRRYPARGAGRSDPIESALVDNTLRQVMANLSTGLLRSGLGSERYNRQYNSFPVYWASAELSAAERITFLEISAAVMNFEYNFALDQLSEVSRRDNMTWLKLFIHNLISDLMAPGRESEEGDEDDD